MSGLQSGPQPIHRGKVRDTYRLNKRHLLVVASDRLSAFDVVMAKPVPGKGKVLTALSQFWFEGLFKDVPNHFVTTDISLLPDALLEIPDLAGRATIVRQAEMLPIECIVRGYLYGSVMNEYREHGTASGVPLPASLVKASRLPEPIFTPSTKAVVGHDENISYAQAAELVDPDTLDLVRVRSIAAYRMVAGYAKERGIILADTKLEFGIIDGEVCLCDEVFTPDSSRFWDAATWVPGQEPTSYDKQPVRDYLTNLGWDKKPPAPDLPDQVIDHTVERYEEVERVLTSR